jgi:Sap, sulfolipid-1-addressing protein
MGLWLLALEAALYPTLLAAVVILMASDRPKGLLFAYLAGGLTVSISLGLLIVFALDSSNAVTTTRSATSWVTDLVVGALALLAGVVLLTGGDQQLRERREARRAARRPRRAETAPEPPREPWSRRLLGRGSAPIVFVVALVVNVPGAAYLVGLKDIAAGNHATGTAIALVVAFNLVMFILAEVPLLGLTFAPERTGEIVRDADAWMSTHGRQLAIGVCLTLGAFLVVRGIVHS